MGIPKKKICTRCGKEFETCIAGQDECGGCMVLPLRMDPTDERPIESSKGKGMKLKEKKCVNCGEWYTPTGPRQVRCENCKGATHNPPPLDLSGVPPPPPPEAPSSSDDLQFKSIAAEVRSIMDRIGATGVTIHFDRNRMMIG